MKNKKKNDPGSDTTFSGLFLMKNIKMDKVRERKRETEGINYGERGREIEKADFFSLTSLTIYY